MIRVSNYQIYKLLIEVKTKQCIDHFAKLKQEKENSMDVSYMQNMDQIVGNEFKQDLKDQKEIKMKESEERMNKRKEKLKKMEKRKLKKIEKNKIDIQKEEEE